MLDFTDGTTWFVCGLGVTALLAAAVVVFAMLARRIELR
jgi:hypothetical protein